ncbi:hypothetical protein B9Z55_024356 [Caenorhabditis nigoni]|uniref:Uncharacterized protein n=1 Tax=Caenorhabditis nigoni TaxID=1611254 RepID=A0A2G5STX5_9PELO|nr:hypothetical protein B9Z55_024356 [Caenorhabditis nigoni]
MSPPISSPSTPSPPKYQRKSRSDNNNSQNTNPDEESLQVNLDSSPSGTPSRHASSVDLLKSPVVGRITNPSRTPPPVPKKKALRGCQLNLFFTIKFLSLQLKEQIRVRDPVHMISNPVLRILITLQLVMLRFQF